MGLESLRRVLVIGADGGRGCEFGPDICADWFVGVCARCCVDYGRRRGLGMPIDPVDAREDGDLVA